MRENKGYSLVELIVIIAIMAVLTGVVSIGMSNIFHSKVTNCSESIESILNKVKTKTMGKDSVTLRIYQGNEGQYFAEITTAGEANSEIKQIGKTGIDVMFTEDSSVTNMSGSGVAKVDKDTNTEINIEFDRGSGAVKTDAGGNCVRRIWVTHNGYTKTIVIYQETGKIEMD